MKSKPFALFMLYLAVFAQAALAGGLHSICLCTALGCEPHIESESGDGCCSTPEPAGDFLDAQAAIDCCLCPSGEITISEPVSFVQAASSNPLPCQNADAPLPALSTETTHSVFLQSRLITSSQDSHRLQESIRLRI